MLLQSTESICEGVEMLHLNNMLDFECVPLFARSFKELPYFGGLAYYQCVRHLGVAGLTFVEEDDAEVFFLMMQK